MRDARLAVACVALSVLLSMSCGDSKADSEKSTPQPGVTVGPSSLTVPPTGPAPTGKYNELLWEGPSIGGLLAADGSTIKIGGDDCGRLSDLVWAPSGALFKGNCEVGGLDQLTVFDAVGHRLDQLPHRVSESMWAPSGDALAYVKRTADHRMGAVVILRSLADKEETEIPEAWEGAYASRDPADTSCYPQDDRATCRVLPDGRSFAFYRSAYASCLPQCSQGLMVHNLSAGEERGFGDMVPLRWALEGSALIGAANYRWEGFVVTFAAQLIDVSTGIVTPLPALDNYVEIWLSPDSTHAAFATRRAGTQSADLGTLDLRTGVSVIVTGATLERSGAGAQKGEVLVTDDGRVHWLQDSRRGMDLFRIEADGSQNQRIGSFALAYDGAISPDLRHVAYSTAGDSSFPELHVARVDGSDAYRLAESAQYVWRPAAPP